MLVRFLKPWRMYQPDEVATFEDELAAKIVAGGIGVEEAAAAEPDAAPEAQPDATVGKRQR